MGLVRCEDENHEFPVELLLEAEVVGDRQVCVGQEIDGNTVFDINTEGFNIEDINEFEETLKENTTLAGCRHEHHDDHYILNIKGIPDNLNYRMQSYDTIFYYMANASLTKEYYSNQN